MQSEKILIIDDDRNIRKLLEVNLAARGYTVETASDGEDGMELLVRLQPDLVILDLMMHEFNGWEVCRFIREDPVLEKTRVLILTARDSEEEKKAALEIGGADRYITKPFEMDQLLTSISEMLSTPTP
ncbi:MAG: response regulator transcription factor [Chitinivibrionales bacterium]